MALTELIDRAHRLRRQEDELRERLAKTREELDAVKQALETALRDDGRAVSTLSEDEFQRLLGELDDARAIAVSVVYATPEKQRVEEIQLSAGACIEDAIMVSGILQHFPEIDLAEFKVGVHGAIKPLAHTLHAGDRVEIYRPVTKA